MRGRTPAEGEGFGRGAEGQNERARVPARVVRSRARGTTTETATSTRLGALPSLEARRGVAPRREACPAEKAVAGPLLTEEMGSCSSKPGEVGAMPQQGSGSAAPVDPQAIEAVRASANALHPKPATPERPVSPGYDRRVVSHDASKKPPAARAIVPEPFGFDEPVAPGPRELPPTPVAPRAARADDDAWPPRLDVEDARLARHGEIPPGATNAGVESPSDLARDQPDHDDLSPRTPGGGPLTLKRARELRADPSSAADANPTTSAQAAADADAAATRTAGVRWPDPDSDGVLMYSVDGTVSMVRVNASPLPGARSTRPGSRQRPLPGATTTTTTTTTSSRPESREFVSRPSTRGDDGGRARTPRLTAAEVMGAMSGRDAMPAARDARTNAAPAPQPRDAFGDRDARLSDFSDDEPEETLAMARERARYEEGIGLDDEEGLFGDDAPREERTVGARARGETASTTAATAATWRPGAALRVAPAEPERKKSPLELELEQWGVRLPSADETDAETDADGDVADEVEASALADETETEEKEGKTTRSDEAAAATADDSAGTNASGELPESPALPARPKSRAAWEPLETLESIDGSGAEGWFAGQAAARPRTAAAAAAAAADAEADAFAFAFASEFARPTTAPTRVAFARETLPNDDSYTNSNGSGALTGTGTVNGSGNAAVVAAAAAMEAAAEAAEKAAAAAETSSSPYGSETSADENAPSGNAVGVVRARPPPANDASADASDDETDAPTLASLRKSMKEKEAANRPPTSRPPTRPPGVLKERREFAPAPAEEDPDGGAVDLRLRPPAIAQALDDAPGGPAAAAAREASSPRAGESASEPFERPILRPRSRPGSAGSTRSEDPSIDAGVPFQSRGDSPTSVAGTLKAETLRAYESAGASAAAASGGASENAASARRLERRKSRIPTPTFDASPRDPSPRAANLHSKLPPPPGRLIAPAAKEATRDPPDASSSAAAAATATSASAKSATRTKASDRPSATVRSAARPTSARPASRPASSTGTARLKSTAAAGYVGSGLKTDTRTGVGAGVGTVAGTVAGTVEGTVKAEDPAKRKETYRNRLHSHRIVGRKEDAGAAAAEAGAEEDGPVPSTTPVKLRKPPAAPADGSRSLDAAAVPALSKAEEARNRLRGSRQRRSSSGASSFAAAEESRDAVSLSSGGAEAAAAAAKLADKLGSVTGIKPRSSMPNFPIKSKAGDGAAKRAAAFESAERAAAERASAAAAAAPPPPPPEDHVPGLDEAELVLRLGSLADAEQLAVARAAVARMTELLEDVHGTSRNLRCEPQNVYGHLLHRIGQPVDRESRELPLERALGRDKVLEMVAVTTEMRGLLRIKVQDNNDLRLAATALRETTGFFRRLDDAAAKRGMAPHAILAAQRPASRGR